MINTNRCRTLLLTLFAATITLVSAPAANAQFGGNDLQRLTKPPITTRDVDTMTSVLDLSEEQEQIAQEMLAVYLDRFNTLAEQAQAMMQSAMREMQQTGDSSVWGEVSQRLIKFEEVRDTVVQEYFTDVKAILTEEQMEDWPTFERRHFRRENMGQLASGGNFVGGAAVDLVVLYEEFEPEGETKELIAPIIERYEANLDRELRAMKELGAEQRDEWLEISKSGDWLGNMDKMEELFADIRDQIVKVRDINMRIARELAAQLPAETGNKLWREFMEQGFPGIYKDTVFDSTLRTIKEQGELTAEQSDDIATLEDAYRAELNALRNALVEEKLETDAAIKMQSFWGQGNRSDKMKELEERQDSMLASYREQLEGLLTPAQIKLLPSKGDSDWRNRDFDF